MFIDKMMAVLDYYRAFGFQSFSIIGRLMSVSDGKTVEVKLAGGSGTFKLRKGTSDENVFYQVFLRRECEEIFEIEPATILDCGAHIGCAAVYFAQRFPQAEIVCVEPEPGNYALLKQNTAPYPKIRCIFGALNSQSGQVQIANPNAPTYHYRVENHSRGDIPAYSMQDLMRTIGWSRVDLLKMDIEGSEQGVFANSQSWIGDVGVLLIELHDEVVPGCSRSLYEALPEHYMQRVCGDHVVIRIAVVGDGHRP